MISSASLLKNTKMCCLHSESNRWVNVKTPKAAYTLTEGSIKEHKRQLKNLLLMVGMCRLRRLLHCFFVKPKQRINAQKPYPKNTGATSNHQ